MKHQTGVGRPRKERPDSLYGRLGARVHELRVARGLTSQELAKAAGVSFGLVLKVEAGHASIQLGTVLAIAEALTVPPSKLLKGLEGWQ